MILDILLTLVTERGEEQREEGESMREMAYLRGFILYKNSYEVYQR